MLDPIQAETAQGLGRLVGAATMHSGPTYDVTEMATHAAIASAAMSDMDGSARREFVLRVIEHARAAYAAKQERGPRHV